MKQVYAKNLWGGDPGQFYSGIGSHHPKVVIPYIKTVASFLKSLEVPPVVCDLGCGDFHIGKRLLPYCHRYVGVDIVPELIAHHQGRFQLPKASFHCLDLAMEDLPEGNCALLRQVLQHLSNAEVAAILPKLKRYRYVLVTEHVPEGDFEPNKDIISGQGTRLKYHSGLDLGAPPFGLRAKEQQLLLQYKSPQWKGMIITWLYRF